MPSINFLSFIEPLQNWCYATSLLIRSFELRSQQPDALRHIVVFRHHCATISPTSTSDHGVDIRLGACMGYPSFPHLNKVHLLNYADKRDYQVILDHDMIAVQPDMIHAYLGSTVMGVANKKDYVGRDLGGVQLRHFVRMLTGRDWDHIFYFNAGLIVIPTQYIERLACSWKMVAERTIDYFGLQHHKQPFPVANLTLSLAIAHGALPTAQLPNKFNQRNWGLLPDTPYLLHYNNFDPDNVLVKTTFLVDTPTFRGFLSSTTNLWWSKYRAYFLSLLDRRQEHILNTLATYSEKSC